jgi:bacterioferritin
MSSRERLEAAEGGPNAMQGDPRIIDLLNQVLRKELTGINQYFIHSRMCENWGYKTLAKVHYDESIDEMKHADRVIKRIIFLEGVPNVSDYDVIRVGRNVREQLDSDLGLEMGALEVLRRGVRLCLEGHDDASRTERHVDWLEAQKHQIQEIGYENYLAQQIHD